MFKLKLYNKFFLYKSFLNNLVIFKFYLVLVYSIKHINNFVSLERKINIDNLRRLFKWFILNSHDSTQLMWRSNIQNLV